MLNIVILLEKLFSSLEKPTKRVDIYFMGCPTRETSETLQRKIVRITVARESSVYAVNWEDSQYLLNQRDNSCG